MYGKKGLGFIERAQCADFVNLIVEPIMTTINPNQKKAYKTAMTGESEFAKKETLMNLPLPRIPSVDQLDPKVSPRPPPIVKQDSVLKLQ